MKEFPRWYLTLSFMTLWPLIVVPVFLMWQPRTGHSVLNILAYIAVNLIWIVPVVMFFLGLNEYRRGYHKRAYAITWSTLALSIVASVWLLVC